MSEKAAAITTTRKTPEIGAGLGITPGVGVGSGIDGLGAKTICGWVGCANRVDDRLGIESKVKKSRASTVTLSLP